jgi:hypothetical protein
MAAKPLREYDVKWDEPHLPIQVTILEARTRSPVLQGNYLTCARMNVDVGPTGLSAVSQTGSSCISSPGLDQWLLSVVAEGPRVDIATDIEDFIGLVLSTGWLRAGWIPTHAGAVASGSCCAVLCAPTMAGKSTLVAAMARRQWRVLGDDKLLLRVGEAGPELAALAYGMNLDPATRKWFPEVGDLYALPRQSFYSEKRRVNLEDFWPKKGIRAGRPSHLLQIARGGQTAGIKVKRLEGIDVLSALLRQTVIPTNVEIANKVLSVMVETAKHLRGFGVEIGEDAYSDADCLAPLEKELR